MMGKIALHSPNMRDDVCVARVGAEQCGLTSFQHESLEFICQTSRWPMWPRLPLKYRGEDRAYRDSLHGGGAGLLIEVGIQNPPEIRFFPVNIYSRPEEFWSEEEPLDGDGNEKPRLPEGVTLDEESLLKMLRDGWLVD